MPLFRKRIYLRHNSARDARLQGRLRIESRMGTVSFSIHPNLLLPRGITPRVNLAFYLSTPSGHRHRRCPQTPLGFRVLSRCG